MAISVEQVIREGFKVSEPVRVRLLLVVLAYIGLNIVFGIITSPFNIPVSEVDDISWFDSSTAGSLSPGVSDFVKRNAASQPAWLGLLQTLLFFPLEMGIAQIGLDVARRSYDETEVKYMFRFFEEPRFLVKLFIARILVGVLTAVGFILLIVPGVYLAVAYSVVVPILLMERDVSVWDAMEKSRKTITQQFWSVFLLLLASMLIALSGILIIPLYWTIPFLMAIHGVLWVHLFAPSTDPEAQGLVSS